MEKKAPNMRQVNPNVPSLLDTPTGCGRFRLHKEPSERAVVLQKFIASESNAEEASRELPNNMIKAPSTQKQTSSGAGANEDLAKTPIKKNTIKKNIQGLDNKPKKNLTSDLPTFPKEKHTRKEKQTRRNSTSVVLHMPSLQKEHSTRALVFQKSKSERNVTTGSKSFNNKAEQTPKNEHGGQATTKKAPSAPADSSGAGIPKRTNNAKGLEYAGHKARSKNRNYKASKQIPVGSFGGQADSSGAGANGIPTSNNDAEGLEYADHKAQFPGVQFPAQPAGRRHSTNGLCMPSLQKERSAAFQKSKSERTISGTSGDTNNDALQQQIRKLETEVRILELEMKRRKDQQQEAESLAPEGNNKSPGAHMPSLQKEQSTRSVHFEKSKSESNIKVEKALESSAKTSKSESMSKKVKPSNGKRVTSAKSGEAHNIPQAIPNAARAVAFQKSKSENHMKAHNVPASSTKNTLESMSKEVRPSNDKLVMMAKTGEAHIPNASRAVAFQKSKSESHMKVHKSPAKTKRSSVKRVSLPHAADVPPMFAEINKFFENDKKKAQAAKMRNGKLKNAAPATRNSTKQVSANNKAPQPAPVNKESIRKDPSLPQRAVILKNNISPPACEDTSQRVAVLQSNTGPPASASIKKPSSGKPAALSPAVPLAFVKAKKFFEKDVKSSWKSPTKKIKNKGASMSSTTRVPPVNLQSIGKRASMPNLYSKPQVPSLLDDSTGGGRFRLEKEKSARILGFEKSISETNMKGVKNPAYKPPASTTQRRPSNVKRMSAPNTGVPSLFVDANKFFKEATTEGIERFS